ncbi:MAG: GNAT family N-acetyltransferase [Bacteroidetes bacterium]|nr:GNAT family N-acetyltransferase [Bacteroidota bacterium]
MISFPQDLVLEDERVLLRPLEKTDLDFLAPFAINESDIWKFYMTPINSREHMQQYIGITVDQRALQKEYPFIIFDKKANAYAGSSRFYEIQLNNLATQLGYTWYGKSFQRTGLNRHCKLLMLQYAFEKWGMERVEFRAHSKNERSIEAMKAIGCVVEGILRSCVVDVTGRRDSIVLSILKNEWLGGVKEKLIKQIKD